MEQEIELGMFVKDKLTGFAGTVVSRTEYIHDTPQIGIQSWGVGEKGMPKPIAFFPEQGVEQVPSDRDRTKAN